MLPIAFYLVVESTLLRYNPEMTYHAVEIDSAQTLGNEVYFPANAKETYVELEIIQFC